jgi:hypothetical protein
MTFCLLMLALALCAGQHDAYFIVVMALFLAVYGLLFVRLPR